MAETMKSKSRRSIDNLIIAIIFLLACSSRAGSAAAETDADLQKKCSDAFTQVFSCLDYSTGKASAPSSTCCSSVSDIRGKNPVCLCFIIQQAFNGSAAIKSLGLKFDNLLQLPGACKLANASLADCPKLLGLPTNSPDTIIFTNATKASSSPSSSSPSTSTPSGITPSKGVMHQIPHDGIFTLAVVSAIFLSIFTGVAALEAKSFLLKSLDLIPSFDQVPAEANFQISPQISS